MIENNDEKIDKIGNSIISYLEFIDKFKKNQKDIIIEDKNKENSETYSFCSFSIECFVVEKKYLDTFKKSVNFEELQKIFKENKEETKSKLKKELKEYLEKNPYVPNGEKVKIYSKEGEMKEITKNFDDYAFVNKELLIDGMDVPQEKLSENLIKVSKNQNITYLLPSSYNFIVIKKNEEKFKNLYYVEENTKKIFVLYYFNEKLIQEKIKNKIKDIYNFKTYYLINSNWFKNYKEFFLYDSIKDKIKKAFENKKYTYKKIRLDLNNIILNEIGQIRLYSGTQIDEKSRNATNLILESQRIYANKQEEDIMHSYLEETLDPEQDNIYYNFPNEFEIINEDIFKLLMKEEFFYNINEDLKDKLYYEILLGNNQIIIKNKYNEENKNSYLYNYLIYTLNEDCNNEKNKKYILKYILNYYKENTFFTDYQKIIEKGIKEYFYENNINIKEKNEEVKIFDDKRNVLGNFINIDLNKRDIDNNKFNCLGTEDNNDIKDTKDIKENEDNKDNNDHKDFKDEIKICKDTEYIINGANIYAKIKIVNEFSTEIKGINIMKNNDKLSIDTQNEINFIGQNIKDKYNNNLNNETKEEEIEKKEEPNIIQGKNEEEKKQNIEQININDENNDSFEEGETPEEVYDNENNNKENKEDEPKKVNEEKEQENENEIKKAEEKKDIDEKVKKVYNNDEIKERISLIFDYYNQLIGDNYLDIQKKENIEIKDFTYEEINEKISQQQLPNIILN